VAVPEHPIAARLQRNILEVERHVQTMQARANSLSSQLDHIKLDIAMMDQALSNMIEVYREFVEVDVPFDRDGFFARLEQMDEVAV
jgi:prefoldin subunit 5